MELSAATVLVGALMVIGLQMLGSMKNNLRETERRSVAVQLVANLMEQATLMDPAKLAQMTEEERRAIGLHLAPEHAEMLPEAKLTIESEPAHTGDGEPKSHRVVVTLTWLTHAGQEASPLRLVAWVTDREETP